MLHKYIAIHFLRNIKFAVKLVRYFIFGRYRLECRAVILFNA